MLLKPYYEQRSSQLIINLIISVVIIMSAIFLLMLLTRLTKQQEKISESKVTLEQAQRIAKVGHWELNLLSGKLTWSDEIFRIFGLNPLEFKATYEAFVDTIHPADRDLVNDAYQNSVKLKTSYEITHRIIRKKDSQVRWVHESAEHEFDKQGNVIISRGTVQDISDLKKTQYCFR